MAWWTIALVMRAATPGSCIHGFSHDRHTITGWPPMSTRAPLHST